MGWICASGTGRSRHRGSLCISGIFGLASFPLLGSLGNKQSYVFFLDIPLSFIFWDHPLVGISCLFGLLFCPEEFWERWLLIVLGWLITFPRPLMIESENGKREFC